MKKIIALLFALVLVPLVGATEISLETESGRLFGTLEGAPEKNSHVVLIHPGSGPTDRDGNSPVIPGANNSLKYIADHLSKKGIASLRIDKRGIAASQAAGMKEVDLRFENYVEDCAAWAAELKKRGFSKVVILGHSEGSLIGMIAVMKSGAAGFISVAGPARPANEILEEQLAGKLTPQLKKQSDDVLSSLTKGEMNDEVPAALNSLYRPSVQPYLISWFAYDPSAEIAKVDVPVLILQGTSDVQVPESAALALKKNAKDATVVIVEGMNHVLKEAEMDNASQMKAYSDPELPVCQELLDAAVKFVQGL